MYNSFIHQINKQLLAKGNQSLPNWLIYKTNIEYITQFIEHNRISIYKFHTQKLMVSGK